MLSNALASGPLGLSSSAAGAARELSQKVQIWRKWRKPKKRSDAADADVDPCRGGKVSQGRSFASRLTPNAAAAAARAFFLTFCVAPSKLDRRLLLLFPRTWYVFGVSCYRRGLPNRKLFRPRLSGAGFDPFQGRRWETWECTRKRVFPS